MNSIFMIEALAASGQNFKNKFIDTAKSNGIIIKKLVFSNKKLELEIEPIMIPYGSGAVSVLITMKQNVPDILENLFVNDVIAKYLDFNVIISGFSRKTTSITSKSIETEIKGINDLIDKFNKINDFIKDIGNLDRNKLLALQDTKEVLPQGVAGNNIEQKGHIDNPTITSDKLGDVKKAKMPDDYKLDKTPVGKTKIDTERFPVDIRADKDNKHNSVDPVNASNCVGVENVKKTLRNSGLNNINELSVVQNEDGTYEFDIDAVAAINDLYVSFLISNSFEKIDETELGNSILKYATVKYNVPGFTCTTFLSVQDQFDKTLNKLERFKNLIKTMDSISIASLVKGE